MGLEARAAELESTARRKVPSRIKS